MLESKIPDCQIVEIIITRAYELLKADNNINVESYKISQTVCSHIRQTNPEDCKSQLIRSSGLIV